VLKVPPLPAEPCHGLQEFPKNGKWVQRTFVIRDGQMACFQRVIGPADDYRRVQPLVMPSFGENTVAEMQYWGEKNRHDTYWADRSDQMLKESTLIRDHINQIEEMAMVRRNRSVLGPHQSTQRIGYPREATQRRFKEKHGNRKNA
jgi:hypothetical protein